MIPASGGLCYLLLTELHSLPLVAHPGVCKTIGLLFSGFDGPSYGFLWLALFMVVIFVSRSRIPHNCILGCYNLYRFLKGNSRTLVSSLLWIYPLVRGLTLS